MMHRERLTAANPALLDLDTDDALACSLCRLRAMLVTAEAVLLSRARADGLAHRPL